MFNNGNKNMKSGFKKQFEKIILKPQKLEK